MERNIACQKINVSKDGRKYVHMARIVYKSRKMCLIEIDMHLKRAIVDCICSGAITSTGKLLDYPSIFFSSGSNSYYNGKRVRNGKVVGAIYFLEMDEWDIYGAWEHGRYTLSVLFSKRQKSRGAEHLCQH